ncbi:MAG TPA: hypothetical protein VFU31_24760 [Candidatus Binatia bacterium]|nr:hypothetical protein [Candidatus Binatia bacterium]
MNDDALALARKVCNGHVFGGPSEVYDATKKLAIALLAMRDSSARSESAGRATAHPSGEGACDGQKGYFTAAHLGRQWVCTDPDCSWRRMNPRGENDVDARPALEREARPAETTREQHRPDNSRDAGERPGLPSAETTTGETPRTDSAQIHSSDVLDYVVPANIARQLERELAEANEQIKRLRVIKP